jgi:hypothetical protein
MNVRTCWLKDVFFFFSLNMRYTIICMLVPSPLHEEDTTRLSLSLEARHRYIFACLLWFNPGALVRTPSLVRIQGAGL